MIYSSKYVNFDQNYQENVHTKNKKKAIYEVDTEKLNLMEIRRKLNKQ